jgi:uncharacterized protein (TIGR03437 family)
MGRNATVRRLGVPAALLLAGTAAAQIPAPDWRPMGSELIELSLASPASGPVERVWFSSDGAALLVRTRSGLVFRAEADGRWTPAEGQAPPPRTGIREHPLSPGRLYALAGHVYRSDDGGRSWRNLTAYQQESIIGGGMRDLAVSPQQPDIVVVANDYGVWRSADGGLSWSGIHQGLPNLPVRRILGAPESLRGLRIEAEGIGPLEWAPGERQAWRPVRDAAFEQEAALRSLLSEALRAEFSAVAAAGDYLYAGARDGRLWVSPDRGESWRLPWRPDSPGPVESIWVDRSEPRVALAALGGAGGARLLRTTNGGLFWDDLSADLPEGAAARGVTADASSGAVYLATDRGLYLTRADLRAPGPATPWRRLGGLPESAARDVRLDAGANQLFVALEGYGVYAAPAPHRRWAPQVVNAADSSPRAAAPGSLLSVVGARIEQAQAGGLAAPVLAASESESQIQIPFEALGERLVLALRAGSQSLRFDYPLQEVSPAIVLDREGAPLVVEAAGGVLLDGMNPARSGSRIQVLATGLGRVRPAWPTGLPAPLADPPAVAAPVRAYLDRAPLEVTRATLAPGYVGLYLVEVQLPEIVNLGPAEFYLESEGRQSNRVRLYVAP